MPASLGPEEDAATDQEWRDPDEALRRQLRPRGEREASRYRAFR